MRLKNILIYAVFSCSSLFAGEPYLTLHFDVNKTLIASDQAGGKSTENVLNELLAAKYTFRWDPTLHEPMTYETYVKDVLLPKNPKDPDLKSKRQQLIWNFTHYLKEQNHPLQDEVLRIYHLAKDKLSAHSSAIFPSFYRLVEALDAAGQDYS